MSYKIENIEEIIKEITEEIFLDLKVIAVVQQAVKWVNYRLMPTHTFVKFKNTK